MNPTVLIVPHFGQFNAYLDFWIHSCRANSDIVDVLIFTDK